MTPRTVLVVDDDPGIRSLLELALGSRGHEVLLATDGAGAARLAASDDPDVVLLDLRLGDGAASAIGPIRELAPNARIVVVSAARTARAEAAQLAADGYLAKPFDLDDLFLAVEEDPSPA